MIISREMLVAIEPAAQTIPFHANQETETQLSFDVKCTKCVTRKAGKTELLTKNSQLSTKADPFMSKYGVSCSLFRPTTK